MRQKISFTVLSFCILLFTYTSSFSEELLPFRKQMVLESVTAKVSVDIAGGSIICFSLKNSDINPLTWNYPEKGDTAPRTIGHFVCFDRWGSPSPAELKNGMPFHGEATSVTWDVFSKPAKSGAVIKAELGCSLPIAGMKLDRSMELSDNAPVLFVKETFTNLNKLGRVCNIVQHPSIGPPFLDKNTVVDTNAGKGIILTDPNPGAQIIEWPKIAYQNKFIDLRTLYDDDHVPGVTCFVFADSLEYGMGDSLQS